MILEQSWHPDDIDTNLKFWPFVVEEAAKAGVRPQRPSKRSPEVPRFLGAASPQDRAVRPPYLVQPLDDVHPRPSVQFGRDRDTIQGLELGVVSQHGEEALLAFRVPRIEIRVQAEMEALEGVDPGRKQYAQEAGCEHSRVLHGERIAFAEDGPCFSVDESACEQDLGVWAFVHLCGRGADSVCLGRP